MTAPPLMDRHEERKPWGLILALVIASTAGVVSIPLQISVLQRTDSASAADVRRAQDLTTQLAEQQAASAAESMAFREDSRRLQLAICDQIEAVARQARLQVPECPRIVFTPAPTPAPIPSPTG